MAGSLHGPGERHGEIRTEVARPCTGLPGDCWRRPDGSRAYPTKSVQAWTASGSLAALVPEACGGAGLPGMNAERILITAGCMRGTARSTVAGLT